MGKVAGKCNLTYGIHTLHGTELQRRNVTCERPCDASGRCFFHLDDPRKSIEPFLEEIERQETSEKICDFSQFIFPEESIIIHKSFKNEIFFDGSTFYGDVTIQGSIFNSGVSFHSAHFHGKTDFRDAGDIYSKRTKFLKSAIFNSCHFYKQTSFRACNFSVPPQFVGTVFHDIVSFPFSVVQLSGTFPVLKFESVDFSEDADLPFKIHGEDPAIKFHGCNLEGLKISSLPRHQAKIDFEKIRKWDGERSTNFIRDLFYKRKKIRDERIPGIDPVTVVDNYRYLEKYFYERSDYSLASYFYVGQMIVRRKDSNYRRIPRIVNWLYQKISNFGESIIRPIFFLIMVWAIFPAWLLLLGMPVGSSSADTPKPRIVKYDLTFNIKETPWHQYWEDYRSAFGSNLSLSTFDRHHEFSPPSDSLQKATLIFETILNVIFVSFVVVAARRKFTPKKPTGS